MSDGQNQEFTLSQPKPEGFKTSMFGFQKAEVLSYIEKLSGENLARQKELQAQIDSLEEKLAAGEQERAAVMEKVQEACVQLKSEQEARKAAELRSEEAQGTIRDLRDREMRKEQELIRLRSEKTQLEERLAQMEQELESAKSREKEVGAAIVGAQRAADAIVDSAKKQAQAQRQEFAESARDIGATVRRLKEELAQVETRIDVAFGAMKDATAEIEHAVEKVDERVSTFAAESVKEPPKKASAPDPEKGTSEKAGGFGAASAKEKVVPQLEEAVSEMAEKVAPTLHRLQELVIDSINKLLGD